jgi:hypothetical protein
MKSINHEALLTFRNQFIYRFDMAEPVDSNISLNTLQGWLVWVPVEIIVKIKSKMAPGVTAFKRS